MRWWRRLLARAEYVFGVWRMEARLLELSPEQADEELTALKSRRDRQLADPDYIVEDW